MRALSGCADVAAACLCAYVCPSSCRNDTIGGPLGRRGDRVGGPYYMHRDDLKFLAPQWLNYTHIMRNDMEVRQLASSTAKCARWLYGGCIVCQLVSKEDTHLSISHPPTHPPS